MRTQERQVEAPIFVVGCGRSGTTLLYEILAVHRSLAWFSKLYESMAKIARISWTLQILPICTAAPTGLQDGTATK
jgi:hypothetical protein